MDGTGVTIGPSPPPGQLTAHQTVQTPSRAEHGSGGRFALIIGDEWPRNEPSLDGRGGSREKDHQVGVQNSPNAVTLLDVS